MDNHQITRAVTPFSEPPRAGDNLRELADLKDTFVSLVSHELRTPVTLVVGYLEMGVQELSGKISEEELEHLQIALAHSRQLARIVQELTDFARLQRVKPVELADPTPLGEAIIQVFTMLRPFIESKSLKASLDLPSDLAQLRYDGESLIIIFRNLLSNSAKFTPDGGNISVVGRHLRGQHTVGIWVHDSAPPIPPEKRAVIFEDFRQVENYLTRGYEGMGLGLAVARRTARALGGNITLEVKEPGNTFLVTLSDSQTT